MIDSNNQQADDLLTPSLVAAGQAIETIEALDVSKLTAQ